MTEQDLAAPSAEADDVGVSVEQDASESPEGQVEAQPAEDSAEDGDQSEEKSKAKARRERREAAERRAKEEAETSKRDAEAAKAKLARIEQSITGLKEPNEADFDDPLVFASAKALWLAKRGDRSEEAEATRAEIQKAQEAQDRAEQARIAALAKDFKESEPEARARYADYDTVFNSAVIPQELAVLILEGDAPHDVAYHLGKNPDLNRRILNMNPVQAARELGRIEASLSLPKPKTQSTAPAPYSPTKGGGSAANDPERMSPSEFAAWRKSGGTVSL